MAFPAGAAVWRGTRGIARSSSTRLPSLRPCLASPGATAVFFPSCPLRGLKMRAERPRSQGSWPLPRLEMRPSLGAQCNPGSQASSGWRLPRDMPPPWRGLGSPFPSTTGLHPWLLYTAPMRGLWSSFPSPSSLPQTRLKRVALGCMKRT